MGLRVLCLLLKWSGVGWGGEQWNCCLKYYDQVSIMYIASVMLTSLLK